MELFQLPDFRGCGDTPHMFKDIVWVTVGIMEGLQVHSHNVSDH